MPASSPSTLIADALASFSKATNLAFTTVEDNARAEVARVRVDAEKARADAEKARAERDEARGTLQELRIEEKEWTRKIEGLRASLDKADITIKHQTETITQLRAEVQQWKLQLTRLEETSRQEVLAWKEQCMRADDERCRLSARVEELVTDQLAWNTNANAALALAAAPYTSRPSYRPLTVDASGLEPSTTSTLAKRASTSSHVPSFPNRGASPVYSESVPPPPTRRSKPASQIQRPPSPAPSTGAPARVPHPKTLPQPGAQVKTLRLSAATQPDPGASPARGMTRARVIRRVQAVVEVKHESSDDENVPPPPPVRRAPRSVSQGAYVSVDEAGGPEAGEDSGEGSEYEPDKPARAGQRRDSQARAQAARQRRKSAVWAEDQIRRHATAAEAAGAQQEESEDDEEVARVKQRPRPRPPVDSDDDDELLMGPDTSREEHPTQVPKPRASLAKTPASKKRKLDSEHVLHTGRTPATKVARKKP